MRLILIEGLPGTGKSTLAEHLCRLALQAGFKSEWHLEEAVDHPVHPRSLGASKSQADYAHRCLQSWQHFANITRPANALCILEGSALQSTVRFMMEQERQGIADYFRHFEEIVRPLQPAFIYLRPENANSHSQGVAGHRGPGWTQKVTAHVEQTPYASNRNARGEGGMHRFWSDYAQLCDALVKQLSMPVLTIRAMPGFEDQVLSKSVEFLRI